MNAMQTLGEPAHFSSTYSLPRSRKTHLRTVGPHKAASLPDIDTTASRAIAEWKRVEDVKAMTASAERPKKSHLTLNSRKGVLVARLSSALGYPSKLLRRFLP